MIYRSYTSIEPPPIDPPRDSFLGFFQRLLQLLLPTFEVASRPLRFSLHLLILLSPLPFYIEDRRILLFLRRFQWESAEGATEGAKREKAKAKLRRIRKFEYSSSVQQPGTSSTEDKGADGCPTIGRNFTKFRNYN